VEGKVAEINAQTEDKRRLSEVARAETEARVLDRRTRAEVDRQRLLTRHEVERRQELNRVDIDKQKQLDQVAITREKGLALLTAENPSYAAYLVNRELASKVQIAVLPLGTESGVLGNMLQSTLGGVNSQRPRR
jgi:hypothetical protein